MGYKKLLLPVIMENRTDMKCLFEKEEKKKVAVINCLCLVRSKYMTIRNPVKKYGDKTHDRTAVALRTEIAHAHVGM